MIRILAFLLFLFSAPLMAAVESVPPIYKATNNPPTNVLTDAQTACNNFAKYQGFLSGVFVTSPAAYAGGGCQFYNAAGAFSAPSNFPATRSCPVPVSGVAYTYNSATGMCERPAAVPVCVLPKVLDVALNACLVPAKFSGSGGVTVCTSDGVCTGDPTYATAALACASYDAAGGGVSNSRSTFNASTGICKAWLVAPDGSTFGVKYFTPKNSVPCATGDTVCAGVAATAAAASATALASNASAVGSAGTMAAGAAAATAATNAAVAAGATSSVAAAAGINAAAAAAGTAAADAVKAQNACDPLKDASCLGAGLTAGVVPISTPTFSAVPVSFMSSAVCPAPISLSVNLPMIGARSYSISYQPLCDVAGMLRPVFLALAAVTASMIFLAGLTI
jgi:hypothetical protein